MGMALQFSYFFLITTITFHIVAVQGDNSVPDSCQDFYEYACANQSDYDQMDFDHFQVYQMHMMQFMNHLLNLTAPHSSTTTTAPPPKPIRLVVGLYDECRALYLRQGRPSQVGACLLDLERDHVEAVLWIYLRYFSDSTKSAKFNFDQAQLVKAKVNTLMDMIEHEVVVATYWHESYLTDQYSRGNVRKRIKAIKRQIAFPDYLTVLDDNNREVTIPTLEFVYQTSSEEEETEGEEKLYGNSSASASGNFSQLQSKLLVGYYVDSLRLMRDHKARGLERLISVLNAKHRQEFYEFKFWKDVRTTDGSYYLQNQNTIFIPLYDLRPHLFGLHYPALMNLALTGFALGHEYFHALNPLVHGNFTAESVLRVWSPQALQEFHNRSTCFVDQYSALDNDPKQSQPRKIDGNLTLSENLADLGGLMVAYYAAHRHLYLNQAKTVQKTDPLLFVPSDVNKMTAEQAFFMAFALRFCQHERDRANHLDDDRFRYAQPWHRVNQALRNFAPFARAFKCPPDGAMNPTSKCRMW